MALGPGSRGGPDIARYVHIEDENRRDYAAMVTAMDDAIGRIIGALRQHGFGDDNTLVFFASDNGGILEWSSSGNFRAGKGRLYQGGLRSPAVISWPGKLPGGTVVRQPLHIVDLYPTLLGLAGASLKQPLPLDGLDAWPTIAEDPGEQNDQRERKPEILARMHEQLKAIRASAVKPVLPPDVAPQGFKAPAVWGER